MMTNEDYQALNELRERFEQEMAKINEAIQTYFDICDIARKKFAEKTDWALANVHKLQDKRESMYKEYAEKLEVICDKYKEESA